MSEWLKVMLDEIARKKAEAAETAAETERRTRSGGAAPAMAATNATATAAAPAMAAATATAATPGPTRGSAPALEDTPANGA